MIKYFIVLIVLISIKSVFAQKKNDYLLSYIDTTSGQALVGFKNKEGKIVIKAKYWAIGYNAEHAEKIYEAACVYGDSGWVFINKKDSIILKPYIFDNGPDYIKEGLFRFVENGKIGFANKHYEKIIPAMFDFVLFFENGIAEYFIGGNRIKEFSNCKEDCHWWWGNSTGGGYISRTGQLFRKISELKNNIRKARTIDNKLVLLNKHGQIIKTYLH